MNQLEDLFLYSRIVPIAMTPYVSPDGTLTVSSKDTVVWNIKTRMTFSGTSLHLAADKAGLFLPGPDIHAVRKRGMPAPASLSRLSTFSLRVE
jgi:hypothetical protein